MYNLREFVLTHVILVPGARGRGGPSSGPWRHFRGICGIRGIREIVPNRANYMCFCGNSGSGLTPMQCSFFYFFIPLPPKTPSFESFFWRLPARNALKTVCFFTKKVWILLCNCVDRKHGFVCFTFSYPSHAKHTVFIYFFKDCLPEMLSKLCVLAERGIKK